MCCFCCCTFSFLFTLFYITAAAVVVVIVASFFFFDVTILVADVSKLTSSRLFLFHFVFFFWLFCCYSFFVLWRDKSEGERETGPARTSERANERDKLRRTMKF